MNKFSKVSSTHKVLIGTIVSGMGVFNVAQAATEKAALEACADAMMNDISGYGSTPEYSVKNLKLANARIIRRPDTFHLDARGSKSDDVIGRYDCIVNRDAEVVELIVLPLDASDARSRALGMK